MINLIKKFLRNQSSIAHKVDDEIHEIEKLSIEEAYSKVIETINSDNGYLEVQKTTSRAPLEMKSLDPLTAKFFTDYEEIHIIQSDVTVRIFTQQDSDPSGVMVARSLADNYAIFIANGKPEVIEKRDGTELERFESLFHFFLVVSML